jgi:hypothetical protein
MEIRLLWLAASKLLSKLICYPVIEATVTSYEYEYGGYLAKLNLFASQFQ